MKKLYVSNKDESIPLFRNAFLDKFTHVHWTVPLILWTPVVLYFLYRTVATGEVSGAGVVGLLVAGTFIWTLTEYLLHRFVFHYEPTSKIGQTIHFYTHGIHHDYPNDSTRLVMPPVVSVPLATLFYFLFDAVLPSASVGAFFAGFIAGYITYDTVHYATHHARMENAVGRYLKKYHIRHHYLDPDRGYGVSSPLWDYVFGTRFSLKDKAEEAKVNAEAAKA